MKRQVKEFFFFNRKQKIGALIFASLTIVNCLIIWLDPFAAVLSPADFSRYEKAARDLERKAVEASYQNALNTSEMVFETRQFDPNSEPVEGLMALGFPRKLAMRIESYRAKGGAFRSKDDLRKIYGMSEELFLKVEPYIAINIKSSKSEFIRENGKTKARNEIIVDLNQADSLALLGLPGVGPAFAKRILAFRKKLGGFFEKEQLLEVYGFDSVKYDQLKGRITADRLSIVKLDLNGDERELSAHPYIGKALAKRIVSYRVSHGPFRAFDDLFLLQGIEKSKLERAKAYLTIK